MPQNSKTQIHRTPPGRIVGGGYFRPWVDKESGRTEYAVTLAYEPSYNEVFYSTLKALAKEYYPNHNPQYFNWSVKDGSNPKYADKQGYAGNFILRASSKYAPTFYDARGKEIQDPEGQDVLQPGDYAQALITVRPSGAEKHGSDPGLKFWLQGLRFIRRGERIQFGADMSAIAGADDTYGDYEIDDIDHEILNPDNYQPTVGGRAADREIPF